MRPTGTRRHSSTPRRPAPVEYRVGIFLNLLTSLTRSIATGVARYACERGNWRLVVVHDMDEFTVVLGDADFGELDGIVAGYSWERLPRVRCPITYVHTPDPENPNTGPTVCPDNVAIGRMGAAHVASLGFPYFAFVGVQPNAFSRERQEGFEAELRADRRSIQPPFIFAGWDEMMRGTRKVQDWLAKILLPCAIFCADDRIASVVATAARLAKIRVPEQVAILGVNDDDLACASTVPALSSIRLNGDKIGYEAARQLERSMSGESSARPSVVRVGPDHIVQRGSTQVMGYRDATVCEAMRLIRARAPKEPVVVSEIATELRVYRQHLNRSFFECVGRTPKDEIDRIRADRLRALLLSTDLSVKEIAYEMGFNSPSQVVRFCRRTHSKSPLEVRRDK